MSDLLVTSQPSPIAESSRGSARPASARSVRSASNSITSKPGDKFGSTNILGLAADMLPLSARETGTNPGVGSPRGLSRESSKLASSPPSMTNEIEEEPREPSRESSHLASRRASGAGSNRSKPSNGRHSNGSIGANQPGSTDNGDLRPDAQPWNDLPRGSRTSSVSNSIDPYVGDPPESEPGLKPHVKPPPEGGKQPSRPASAAPSNKSNSRASSRAEQQGPPVGTAFLPDHDLVQTGSPRDQPSRESSRLASRTPSASAVAPEPSVGEASADAVPRPAPPPPLSWSLSPSPASAPSAPSVTATATATADPPAPSVATRSAVSRKSGVHRSAADLGYETLPWTAQALFDYRNQMKRCSFELLDPSDSPLSARLDQVFTLPPELWPVLPPGALYCLESNDPRVNFSYLQHVDFPDTKVRVGTYFGKWGRHLVDFVVAWQPTPRHEAAWQPAGAKQPPLPWEPRQVVAHTTNGEYQYANTRMRFRGPKSSAPDAPLVEWSDAHGIDLLDTKAGNQTASRNSDTDRDAHLLDPPRPNTWGEMARRPLIGNLRSRGGGAYVHHVNYDYSGLRTTCGRRVPAGYYFTLVPNAPARAPAVPGGRPRSASVGRSGAGGRSRIAVAPSGAAAASFFGDGLVSRLDSVATLRNSVAAAGGFAMSQSVQALLNGILDGAAEGARGGEGAVSAARPAAAAHGSTGSGSGSRPASGGASRRSSSGSLGAPAGSSGWLLPQMDSLRSLGGITGGFGGVLSGVPSGAVLAREASRPAPTASPTLFALSPKQRWRTYDIPFHHPLHGTRAADLGAAAATAVGTGVRVFSDAAAVLHVAEQELRTSKPFVPGPIVVPSWDDVPRLYAEHMAAARALMPVTELDAYGTSKLHQLVYHLQAAATLEFDRLDAKLALLPQMARLGRKSAEIDAWLQVIVEHAAYLYDKLRINDPDRWPRATPAAGAQPPANAAANAMRRSVTFSKGAPLVAPNPHTAPSPSGPAPVWAFPEPLAGTSFMERSALNIAAQRKAALQEQQVLPAHRVTVEEWAGVTKVMDTCRHAILYDHWIRLRPLMTGSSLPTYSAGVGGSASRAGSVIASSDAAATIFELGADPAVPSAQMDTTYAHGGLNRELLDYVKQDLATMSNPDWSPPPPPTETALPPPKGYRGPGPLPAELVAEMPALPRPARIRGAEETPLPPELEGVDLWNVRSKADQWTSPDVWSPLDNDAGALRVSQASVGRLMAAKAFATSRQAEVRRSIQRAQGQRVFDEESVPDYGSDIAEDPDLESIGTEAQARRRASRRHQDINPSVIPAAPGIATQTAEDLEYYQEERRAEAEARARDLAAAEERRRVLLLGNGGKTREQVLEEALAAAEVAMASLQPRPLGATPLLTPPTPKGMLLETGEPVDETWKPFGRGQAPYNPGSDPRAGQPVEWYRRNSIPRPSEGYGKGPEPLALEKVNAEPSFMSEMEASMAAEEASQKPTKAAASAKAGTFGGVSVGPGGLVDYETAMARRRAIAGAELAHDRSSYLPKSEVFNLFITYCNLGGHPELVDMLQRAIEAPVSVATVQAKAAASAAKASATAGYGGRHLSPPVTDEETEATRQRIRATAWLLGVMWRRINNETYTSFLTRVLCWPTPVVNSLHRTKCTHIIARALVKGHDLEEIPR